MKGILPLLLSTSEFREMFHNAFPKFRVDLGKPLLILAVKNEHSLKILLPGLLGDQGMG
jgi:hypothetical protein